MPERRERDHAGHDERNRQERLDEPAEHVVDEAAEVPHHEPDRRPEDGPEQSRQRGDDQDVARAYDHAGEHVAAELVGPEQVRARGRLVDPLEVLSVRAVRRDR